MPSVRRVLALHGPSCCSVPPCYMAPGTAQHAQHAPGRRTPLGHGRGEGLVGEGSGEQHGTAGLAARTHGPTRAPHLGQWKGRLYVVLSGGRLCLLWQWTVCRDLFEFSMFVPRGDCDGSDTPGAVHHGRCETRWRPPGMKQCYQHGLNGSVAWQETLWQQMRGWDPRK
ncbi:hypothetical protein E2C01_068216 [Portunus trituberculatus]|uniref:Uncharacterized protein n=1 Tax=Portunus trituberculatus TaxID=210409 RepID=A0A5B7HVP3_PORTR|nr:hypothetical protein [Portunus trituberculatus]